MLRFLLLEDSAIDAQLIQQVLASADLEHEVIWVRTRADFLVALNPSIDLVLADYNLPAFGGMEALNVIKQHHPEIPFIIVSGGLGEELAIETLKQGATDYVLKQRLERLVPCVQRALREVEEHRECKRIEAALYNSEAIARARAEELETLMEVIPAGIWLAHDPDCHQVTANRAAYELMRAEPGTTPTDAVYPFKFKVRRNGQDILPEDFSLQRAGRSGQETTEEIELVFEDGMVRHIYGRAMPLRDEAGNVRGVIGAYVDISDRKQAENALQQAYAELAQQANQLAEVNQSLERTLQDFHVQEEELRVQNDELISARGLAETERQRYQDLFNFAPDGYIVTDANGVIQEANQAVKAQLSWDSAAQISTPLAVYVVEADRLAFRNFLFELHKSSHAQTCELSLQPPQGRSFPAEITAAPIRDLRGQISGIRWLIRDITDRKQAEEALRQSESRFRLMIESAKEYAIFTLDLNGIITSWNSGAQRVLGYTESEAIGCHSQIIFTPEDRIEGCPEQEIQTALNQGRAEDERWHVRKDGSRFWAIGLMMPLQTEAGNPPGFIKILQDKTQSRQAAEREQFLAQSSAALAASIDYKKTLITIAQLAVPFLADYCFFDVINNSGQIERVAWSVADPALKDWFDKVQQFIPPQDFNSHPVAKVLQSGHAHFVPEVTEAWMQSVATSSAHLQFMQQCQLRSLITVPLKINQQPIGALTFCFNAYSNRHYVPADLTLAEELARRAALALDNAKLYHQAQEANRIKDEFLAVLSHELRSPLNPILGWARLLQNSNLNPVRQAEALATIERNARLQTQLIDDLLDISRIMQGKLTLTAVPVNLNFVISAALETVRLAAEAKQIQILLDLDPTVSPVSGDAARLQQVVWNLLTNAIKFTSQGGRVEVRLEQKNNGMGEIRPSAPSSLSSYARITVTDTGKGISPDFLPHVFDYFRQADSTTTRNFGGLGLGLAIVRQIVEMHGGTVRADSPGEGQGATFAVQLPTLQQVILRGDEPVQVQVKNQETPLSNLQILVVDDDNDTREFQVFLLEQNGAKVTAVASGLDALQALDQFIPDVIVSDVGMARMDGYMLMQQIRSRPPNQGGQVPAIALTAYARESDQQKAIEAGFQTHITKPVDLEALIAAIVTLLK